MERSLCEPCGIPMRRTGSYPAFEGTVEVHVVVWACPSCGARSEATEAPPELEPAPPRSIRRVA